MVSTNPRQLLARQPIHDAPPPSLVVSYAKPCASYSTSPMIAGDRPGLLARIALIMDQHDIRLHRAKINTLGSRADDVFLISGAILADPSETGAFLDELREKF